MEELFLFLKKIVEQNYFIEERPAFSLKGDGNETLAVARFLTVFGARAVIFSDEGEHLRRYGMAGEFVVRSDGKKISVCYVGAYGDKAKTEISEKIPACGDVVFA